MGKKIFLSYAEEDSAIAKRLADHLKQAGIELYDWQDPSQRGKEFIPEIEKQIIEANIFMALLSPDYLLSPWCKHERNLALRRYEHQKDVVILVARTRDVEYLSAGFLGGFDWLDLTETDWEKNVKTLLEKLSAITSDIKTDMKLEKFSNVDWPSFQNREDELDEIISNLNDMGGERFFLVLSGPQMGKSWLLEEVYIRLLRREGKIDWKIVKVDLRDFTDTVWKEPNFILSRLFNIKSSGMGEVKRIEEIVRVISHAQRSWLCMLDSAELLSRKAAAELRNSLSKIYKEVRNQVPGADFAFIAASRLRHDKWKGISPSPRFKEIPLTHFSFEVIQKALREMTEVDGRNKFKDEWYTDKAFRLKQATEGLPALLVDYMQWVRDKEYVFDAGEVNGRELFDKFAKPFVINALLSPKSLIPSDGDYKLVENERYVLEKTLLGLSCFRIISITYLENVFKVDSDLQNLVILLGWTKEDLWQRLLDTPLIEPSSQIWVRTYVAIRRLLFRYSYDTPQKQASAHLLAGQFYDGFWNELTGTDKAIVLVERFWHQVEYERLTEVKGAQTRLFRFAKELFTTGIKSNHHTREELSGLIEQRISEDEELISSLEEIGSFVVERVLKIVQGKKDG
jgi:hypothetical protein